MLSRSAQASMPIVIGTVPIKEMTQSVESEFIDSKAPIPAPTPGEPLSNDSFENVNFQEEGAEEQSEVKEDEDFEFHPKFAYYSDKTKLINPRN